MKAGDDKIRAVFAGWREWHKYDHEMASKAAGFSSYRTMKRRLDKPETLTVREFRKLVEITKASDEDIIRMVTGRRTRT